MQHLLDDLVGHRGNVRTGQQRLIRAENQRAVRGDAHVVGLADLVHVGGINVEFHDGFLLLHFAVIFSHLPPLYLLLRGGARNCLAKAGQSFWCVSLQPGRVHTASRPAGGNRGAGLRIFRQTGKIPNNPKQTEAANVVFVGIDKKGLRFLNRLL